MDKDIEIMNNKININLPIKILDEKGNTIGQLVDAFQEGDYVKGIMKMNNNVTIGANLFRNPLNIDGKEYVYNPSMTKNSCIDLNKVEIPYSRLKMITCPSCGSQHAAGTMCSKCYKGTNNG